MIHSNHKNLTIVYIFIYVTPSCEVTGETITNLCFSAVLCTARTVSKNWGVAFLMYSTIAYYNGIFKYLIICKWYYVSESL